MKFSNVLISLAIGFIFIVSACKKNNNDPAPNNPPTVSSSNINDQATGVPVNKDIAVTFSEPMDASTITTSTFVVKKGSTIIPGTVSYSGTTATFNPSVVLDANATYTATVTTGVKDASGSALASNVVWSFTTGSSSATLAVVNLRTAANYVLLAKTAINNNPTSAITGAIGLSPAATSYITGLSLTNATGYATSSQVTGHIYAADMVSPTSSNLTTAISDMQTAYTDAAGRKTPDYLELGTGNIGGKTLLPGLYKWTTSVSVPTDVTISGSADDVWIFQISGNLSLSAAVHITLTGGAQAKNIFWQVAGTVTTGTTSHIEGVILSKTGITFNTGTTFKGRALAQTAIILDGNTIVQP
ncbi:ice-binding family protein [Cytophaga aurantiaca]|uniref:ice-binding family protein n=1 Tax=Cytophaga aurantiaca TaxID=29530 RepID=UPI0003A24E89|nr:ice-binding family protein [Cytophaga aurantiaca]